jgi:hypothetical protein
MASNFHHGSRRRPVLIYATPAEPAPPVVEHVPYPHPIVVPHPAPRRPRPVYSAFGFSDAEQVRPPASARPLVVAFHGRPGDRIRASFALSTRYVASPAVEHNPLSRTTVAPRSPRPADRIRRAILVRPEYAPPPPPPTPSPPTPRTLVVPTSALSTPPGDLRRRAILAASILPGTSPVIGALALTRVTAARRYDRPPQPPASLVRTIQTRVVVGGEPPPHTGGGGTPKPLQTSWIAGAITPRHPKPLASPILARTRYTQPPRDGLPNQVTVVAPRRAVRPRPAIFVHPAYKWGVNLGNPSKPAVVVRRPVGVRPTAPVVVASPPTSGYGFPPGFDPVVVRRVVDLRPRPRPTVFGTTIEPRDHVRPSGLVASRPTPKRAAPRIVATSTAESFAVRPIRPPGPTVIPYNRTSRPRGSLLVFGLADAYELAPNSVAAPHVVPRRPRPSDRIRPPLVVATRPAFNPRSIPAFDPVVVARPVRAKASPWSFASRANLFVPPPPPRHDPMSRVVVAPVLRMRSPLMWPRPTATTSILQPDDERYDKPWDLIAACIAWLRDDTRIVAEFGDDADSATGLKFVSDVELPGTEPPYAVFSEPTEIEHYESVDHTNRISSLVEGVFHLTVHDVEKLAVRRLADLTAASLQDAPLVFTDGVLIYLRRSERRFPIVAVPGVAANVTAFKRVVEFTYMIERFV